MYIPGLNVKLTAAYGLAILRIVLGIAMVVHGWAKWQNMEGTAGFFASLGIPLPTLAAYVVGTIELLGGLFLIVGFLTQISGLLIALVMLGAIVYQVLPDAGFMGQNSITFEKEAVFAAAALCLVLAGPGAWSVDDVVVDTRRRA